METVENYERATLRNVVTDFGQFVLLKVRLALNSIWNKGILILLFDTFFNTIIDNNRSVSSGFVRFCGKWQFAQRTHRLYCFDF